MARTLTFFATTSKGIEPILAKELKRLGLQRVVEQPGAVRFMGPLKDGYKACLWSRVASRVHLELFRSQGNTPDDLYEAVRNFPWEDHFSPGRTFAVRFIGRSRLFRDTRFGALKAKDGIVDRLREIWGSRPDVDPKNPDLRITIRLKNGLFTGLLDLSGAPLHERGGERESGKAPVRETLAAAMLLHADWPRRAREGQPLVDPMCGSGTLLLEGAAMALDQAPGLYRKSWGFEGWKQHDAKQWEILKTEAHQKRGRVRNLPPMFGSDIDAAVVSKARRNARSLKLEDAIEWTVRDVLDVTRPDTPPGLVVINPPYGERLGEEEEALQAHADLGETLRTTFGGWTAMLLTTHKKNVQQLRIKPSLTYEIFNGPLRCRFVTLDIWDDTTRLLRDGSII